jgi:PAS domain-containing protein
MIKGALRAGSWVGSVGRVRKDGNGFTAQVSVTPLIGSGGLPEGFLFVSNDMSDEERLVGELERERQSERVLFETSADAMITAGYQGTIHRVNGAALRLFGYGAAIGTLNIALDLPPPRMFGRWRPAWTLSACGRTEPKSRWRSD